MEKNYPGEQWRPVVFDFEFINETRIEISNFGRVKTFNKISDGNIINGSMINGYKIIRLKFFKARDENTQVELDKLQKKVLKLAKNARELNDKLNALKVKDPAFDEYKNEWDESTKALTELKKNASKKFLDDFKKRTIHYHALIHRLVAEYFIAQPSPLHTIVAHLDYNKLNNRRSNLRWMKPEENYYHQRFSPYVIASKIYADGRRKEDSKATKLSVTKVMLLKKLLNKGKSLQQLAKQFKVTATQIARIKRGENWAEVQAAT